MGNAGLSFGNSELPGTVLSGCLTKVAGARRRLSVYRIGLVAFRRTAPKRGGSQRANCLPTSHTASATRAASASVMAGKRGRETSRSYTASVTG